MRKKLIAGNYKMHGTSDSVAALLNAVKNGVAEMDGVDVAVFPTFVHIPLASELLADSSVSFGAQNLYLGESGAFTGEVSGLMLKDFSCESVLIGHSERRHVFNEGLDVCAAKFQSALEFGLEPILCVGETMEQREAGTTESVIADQILSVIDKVGIDVFKNAVIAYEPVWAIGTGLTSTPENAQAVHSFIRNFLAKHNENVAKSMRILYGGSVKPENAKGLFAMPDIDGGLIGGASLDATSFLAICQAAKT